MFIEVEYIKKELWKLSYLCLHFFIYINSSYFSYDLRDGFDQGTMFFRKSKQASIHADELNDKIGEIIG